MSNKCLTPKETAQFITDLSYRKSDMNFNQKVFLSIMAGIYIALGSQAFVTVYNNQFLRAAVFPVGLMLIVVVGGELFTGNNLMTLGLIRKKFSFSDYFYSLLTVYFGNLIGSLFIVFIIYFSGIYNSSALANIIVNIAKVKTSMSFVQALFKGILCNIIVVLAVWMSISAKDIISKILACWFPIMLFVLSGYEHCVANMFFIPLGILLNSNVTVSEMIFNNLLPVTLGNFIGGGIIVPVAYYCAYLKD